MTMERDHGIGRIEAFSDGVFAIAITLLVLNVIEIPKAPGGRLLANLMEHWPVFLAYLIGFLTILVCWINHHFVCDHIARCDNLLYIINGTLLLVVSMVPFVTVLLAEHATDQDRSAAIALYGITFCVMALFYFSIWSYARHRKLIHTDADPVELRAVRSMYLIGIAYTLVTLVVSFLSFHVGMVLYAFLFAGFFLPEYLVKWLKVWLEKRGTA